MAAETRVPTIAVTAAEGGGLSPSSPSLSIVSAPASLHEVLETEVDSAGAGQGHLTAAALNGSESDGGRGEAGADCLGDGEGRRWSAGAGQQQERGFRSQPSSSSSLGAGSVGVSVAAAARRKQRQSKEQPIFKRQRSNSEGPALEDGTDTLVPRSQSLERRGSRNSVLGRLSGARWSADNSSGGGSSNSLWRRSSLEKSRGGGSRDSLGLEQRFSPALSLEDAKVRQVADSDGGALLAPILDLPHDGRDDAVQDPSGDLSTVRIEYPTDSGTGGAVRADAPNAAPNAAPPIDETLLFVPGTEVARAGLGRADSGSWPIRGRSASWGRRQSIIKRTSGTSKVKPLPNNDVKSTLWRGDLTHSLLSLRTSLMLLLFCICYVTCWLVWALVWYLVWLGNKQCLNEIDGFNTCLLFSIETQTTIGYGSKHVVGTCEQGIVVLILQTLCGLILDAFLVGLVFARLTSPEQRKYSMRISKRGVITKRDNVDYLMFRVGDMRHKDTLIGVEARLLMFFDRITEEGEYIPIDVVPLQLDEAAENSYPLFVVPWAIMHPIDNKSPLYKLSTDDLKSINAEIILVIEGTIQTTGLQMQMRESYLPEDLMFDHRFVSMVRRQGDGTTRIDWSLFDTVVPQDNGRRTKTVFSGSGRRQPPSLRSMPSLRHKPEKTPGQGAGRAVSFSGTPEESEAAAPSADRRVRRFYSEGGAGLRRRSTDESLGEAQGSRNWRAAHASTRDSLDSDTCGSHYNDDNDDDDDDDGGDGEDRNTSAEFAEPHGRHTSSCNNDQDDQILIFPPVDADVLPAVACSDV
eukprot:m.196679 g.196679  ORF g.196679 m.196679 type:complete len:804 (-) comp18331_c0_seq3:160-2571(-)